MYVLSSLISCFKQEETLTKQAEAEKRNLKNLVEKLKKEKERLQQDGQALKSKMDEMMKKIKEQVIYETLDHTSQL